MPKSHEKPNHPTQRKTTEEPWPDIKKTNQSTVQHVCLSSQDLNKKTDTDWPDDNNNKDRKTHSLLRRTSIMIEPDDNKTMMAIGRIGSRHALRKRTAMYWSDRHSINATNPRGPQQEGSKADRREVHKTPRRPFSRGKPDLHHHLDKGNPRHARRTDRAPRPSLLLKKTRTQ